ncbi:16S rRNA processing protein [Lactobacillus pasteurii DSM 23907 = CRBIP 24.76]|uniref:Ribosome maturation factor RimM n=1 Tax=Lactobacillus pasteurii DSM 23907 = CRBIP 24.76 TaxID=1423790 RepID=I7KM01_9LACO|nr:ribosome maturation factor RimM [Lactobacillus pasteurii]KRK08429.1 16S rRNA processing protein [Lactobacillus pasteurii DSM 23907 = CRBIP 24.76]TDG75607.1 hypothetical protein C5L33_000492 [Lactobacillus pasteurii]CCI85714.1 Ribosome maturation factor rimM [Lactobacillus pasteurii DSM 23907 = CRBIP 24.76]
MQFYDVAKILTTHGLNGEVKVQVITDFPEDRFETGVKLKLKNSEQVLTVKAGRLFKQFWLVQFEEITSIDQAEKLRGQILVISEEDQQELPEGFYYYHDILGCQVLDQESGEKIGKIVEIETPGANDIWLVKEDNGKEFWLPYIDQVVKKVDIAEKKVYVELMEGLRDED